jgi:hypothetical protein
VGYTTINVDEIEPSGPGGVVRFVRGPEGMTFVAVGARRGAYEPHGPF